MELTSLYQRALAYEGVEELKDSLTSNSTSYDLEGLGVQFPIDYEVHVKGHTDHVRLDLTVWYDIEAPCDRCTRPAHEEVEYDASFTLVGTNNHPLASSDAEDEVIAVSEDGGSLEDLVVSIVIASIPLQILCKDDCKGLCPQCGKDLNEGPCQCDEPEGDPRLAALKGLFSEDKEV